MLEIISTVSALREWRKSIQGRVGFVPTMGALHEGHATLLRAVRPRCDVSVLSIFVNPSQFAPHEDLSKYPRPFEKDLEVAKREKVDVVFAPTPSEIYPMGYSTWVEESERSQLLCGPFRPGHFRGVTTVVLKLFNLVQPDLSLFGLKDAQQYFVLEKMVQDLHLNIQIEGVPTVRESDGLALSSRNVYLSAEDRMKAPLIYQTLRKLRSEIFELSMESEKALENSKFFLKAAGFDVQYLDLLEVPEFKKVEGAVSKQKKHIIAVAAYLGNTRLIDNLII